MKMMTSSRLRELSQYAREAHRPNHLTVSGMKLLYRYGIHLVMDTRKDGGWVECLISAQFDDKAERQVVVLDVPEYLYRTIADSRVDGPNG